MGNLVVILPSDRRSYTASASATATGYPAANIKRIDHLGLPWRGTDTIGDVRADTGASQSIAGIVVWVGANTGYAQVYTSTNGSSWTSRTSSLTISANPWSGRRGVIATFSPVTARHVKVELTALNDPGAPVEVGGLAILGGTTTLDQNFGDLGVRVVVPATVTPYLGGGGEGNDEGGPLVQYRFGKEHWHRAQGNTLATLQALARVPANETVILYENNGNTSEVYALRRVDAGECNVRFKSVSVAMAFEERP